METGGDGVREPAAPAASPTVSEAPASSNSMTVVAPAAATPTTTPAASNDSEHHRFVFGSYGRLSVASDFRGEVGRSARLVTFAPRVDEDDTYAELELRREDRFFEWDTRIVATVAYGGPLFHFDGDFSERIAIRNLYVDTQHQSRRGLGLWAGSRMVRGDDVYLMNFWALDNLNMVGGGARYAVDDVMEISLTVGSAQPNDPFYRQVDRVPARSGFATEEVLVLNRPRWIIAGRATYWPMGRTANTGLKGVFYAEQHFLASGVRNRDDGTRERLPEDQGYVIGGQIGGYHAPTHTFLNLFLRYARGLGVYDPMGAPFSTGTVITTGRAEQTRLAFSGNWEWRDDATFAFGLQIGGYYQYTRDADPAMLNRGAMSEGALSIRPHIWFGDMAGFAIDASHQGVGVAAIDPTTGNPEGGQIEKIAFMPFFSPFGRGTYTRPHIRLIYSASFLDQGARALYPMTDSRIGVGTIHYGGIQVEWWFDSSSYAP